MEKFSMSQKVNDYFSKFYFIKLDELGEDHENYGNMNLNGNSHAPLKINVDYIMKRAKKKALEEIRNKKKSSRNEIIMIDDNYSEFDLKNKKLIKIFQYSELNLPLIKNKNINKSMENLLSYNYEDQNINSLLNKNAQSNNSNNFSEKKQNNTVINIKNIKPKKKIFHMKAQKIKEYRNTRSSRNNAELNSLPKLKNKIFITNRNLKSFIQINKSEIQTEENKRNHILKRNAFLKRYDKKESITKRLTSLNNELIKINKNVSKIRKKSDEDIPQFILRFNNLMNKLYYK